MSSFTNSNIDTVDDVSTTNNSISRNKENMQVQEKNKVELAEENARKLENKLKSEKYLSNESTKDFFNAAILNNLDISNEKVDALYDLPNARGIKAKIDTEIFKDTDGNILYDTKSEEFENMIKEEVVADYLGTNLGTQEYINELVNGKESRNIAQKIYDAIVSFLDKVTGYKSEEAYLRGLKDKFENAFNTEYTDSGENIKYSIVTNSKNQKYVKADRQVITGNDVREWQKQTRNYINGKIRNGKNVNVITDTGDILTITKDTAGKAQFRNEVLRADGTRSTLSNEELLTKLTAETHIDELAKISTKINKLPVADTKNHKFAKDGFDYRRAYFEDFDGQYYKITMSVGKNGNINTIYNIGRLDNLSKKNRSKFSVTAQRPLSQTTNKENLSSINSIPQTKNNGNTNTKYSMQENKNNTENSNKSSFSMKEDNNKLSQNTKGKLEDFLEKHKINDGTRTALGEVKLPEGKRNLPTVQETQYQDAVNNATYIPKDVKTELKKVAKEKNMSLEETKDLIYQSEQSTIENKQVLEDNQQVTQEQIKIAQNEVSEQVKQDSEKFARQVDDYVSGNIKSSDFINVSNTPKILQDIGLPNNQIILKQSKLKTMLQESSNSNDNLHGLPVETVKRIPEAISNPLNVLKSSTNENSIVVITDLADKMERPIIASIEMNYKGQIGNIEFLSNRLTSSYGKNNYDSFMQGEIAKGNLLYDIDEGIIKELSTSTRLQSPEGLSSYVDTVENVSTTNNIIAQNEKNMQVQEDNNVENTGNNVYNSNESESGINGGKQEDSITSKERSEITKESISNETRKNTEIGERRGNNTNGIQESSLGSKEETDFAKSYRAEEERIRKQQGVIYNVEEQNFSKNIKDKYNKKALIFDDIETSFGGGVSVIDNETILFGRTALKDFGYDFLEGHEILEDMYKNHKDVSNSLVNNFIEKIQNDDNFGNVFLKYLGELDEGVSNYYIDKPELIAKEIIADLNGYVNSNTNIEDTIFNELDKNLVKEIQNEVKKLENKIYSKNSNKSSFSTEENIDTDLRAFQRETDRLYKEEKQRSYPESVMKSEYVGEKAQKEARKILKNNTYIPIGNNETIETASKVINTSLKV